MNNHRKDNYLSDKMVGYGFFSGPAKVDVERVFYLGFPTAYGPSIRRLPNLVVPLFEEETQFRIKPEFQHKLKFIEEDDDDFMRCLTIVNMASKRGDKFCCYYNKTLTGADNLDYFDVRQYGR